MKANNIASNGMNSQKILIFSTAYYPFVGGAEVAVKEITDRIVDTQFDLITAKLYHKVIKSKGTFDMPERVGNVNVYRVGFGFKTLDKLLLPFLGALKAISLNKKNKYDKFWCMMVTYASGAAYIANIFSSKKTPIILTLQEGDSEAHFARRWLGLINLSWKLALKRSRVVTVISNYLGERAQKLGFNGEPILIPNGVNVSKYSEIFTDEELSELSESLGRNRENMIMLVSTSRLNIKNGQDLVIKALSFLPQNIHFFNFGSGGDKKYLINLAKTLGVSDRVHLTEYIDHDELPKYLKIADIFIRPSRSEGQGVSFLEAMAAKLPVIATPVGGIPDFIFDNKTGYFCQPENPKSIADIIQRVISDPNKKEVIENAYNLVKEKYDWNLIAKQMSLVFNV